jgi:hypothetical protein
MSGAASEGKMEKIQFRVETYFDPEFFLIE